MAWLTVLLGTLYLHPSDYVASASTPQTSEMAFLTAVKTPRPIQIAR